MAKKANYFAVEWEFYYPPLVAGKTWVAYFQVCRTKKRAVEVSRGIDPAKNRNIRIRPLGYLDTK